VQFGHFRLDPERLILWREDQVVPVGPRVVQTLAILAANPGQVFSKEELIQMVWGDTAVDESSVAHNISVLRKVLKEDPSYAFIIETVPRRGYRLCETPASVPELPTAQGRSDGKASSVDQPLSCDSGSLEPRLLRLPLFGSRAPILYAAVAVVCVLSAIVWWRFHYAHAYVTIRSMPGARVMVDSQDGQVIGGEGTTMFTLTPGIHHLRLGAEGFQIIDRKISPSAGTRTSIDIQLQQVVGGDLIAKLQDQCRFIRLLQSTKAKEHIASNLSPNSLDDPNGAASRACDHLSSAVLDGHPDGIESAATHLKDIFAQLGLPPADPKEQLAVLERDALFYNLVNLAKRAFTAGEMEKAQDYSRQLLQLAPEYKDDWNYGNAVFFGNLVLGRLEVRKSDLDRAGLYLLAAGNTPGSPQLDSFGPNMSLAKDLLEKGRSEVVLRFLVLCHKFWKLDHGKLIRWNAAIRGGQIPDFGGNLYY
jgi:DNA-binding winged helix-turn-helix (wHTH) protein